MVSVSGVRGIVGTDLTPETVARWAAAFGLWGTGDGGRGTGRRPRRPAMVLARDARTSGPMFARAAAAGLQSVGCDVIDLGLVTTPTAQLAVEHHHSAGGVMLTASHNPIEWNALKFIGPDGIFLSAADAERVAARVRGGDLPRADWSAVGDVRADAGALERHMRAVLALPELAVRRPRRRLRVALDCVRGAGGVIMPALLERLGCRVTAINTAPDGRFPRPPEPIPEHLGALGRLVRRTKADVGMAVDPDVDRLALVDERGRPIGEDYTLALAIRAVLGRESRDRGRGPRTGRRPTVVCNLSTSLVVADAARDCGADLVRTPVGEAHVARTMVEIGAVIGGEGNGGVMYPRVHVGRDAPVGAALVVAYLARAGRPLSELVADAPRYVIVKGKTPRGPALEPVYAALRGRFPGADVDAQDGLRLGLEAGWLHVRPSNTEPIIRLIAEAPTRAEADRLVDEAKRLCAAS